jgi:oligopeptidase B
MKNVILLFVFNLIFATSCKNEKSDMKDAKQPPVAQIIAKKLEKHGDVRIDNYYWLNDRKNPKVIDYLHKENEYYESQTAHTKNFQKTLFDEMKARIKEDDESVPYFFNGYWYITRTEKDKDYPIYSRKKEKLTSAEEVLFDCNELAKGKKYFQLSGMSISSDNTMATFAVDTVGRRIYTVGVKNLVTGKILKDKISHAEGTAVWANDNKTIFYATQDKKTLRTDKIFKHKIGDATKNDLLVFHEKDETFNVDINKSKSRKYLMIQSGSTLTSEFQILDANTPDGKFKVFQKRTRGLEYSIEHFENSFFVLTNADKATNFKLMKTDENATAKTNWKDIIAHRNDVLLEDIEVFKNYLVVTERTNGLTKIRIMPNGKPDYYIPFTSETYSAYTSVNVDFDTDILRYGYQSLTTPSSTIDFNMETKTKTVLKEQTVLGGFKKENYTEKRIWATADDGTKVPISIIYKNGLVLNGKNPVLQYAYGSYGYSMDCNFSTTRLSLLDRGFVFALAHIRGGEDLGRQWYEDGKLLKKKNTFADFIACSKFLISEKYTSNKHLYAEGGSAGGLLMGAVANMAPELYNGMIAQVAFVDVVTTMLDDTIPLTTGEYDEWGNPNDKKYYDYMKSYSPYDNVKAQNYPNMYVSTGLHDSQVQYWEPAKWVAKLRATKTNKNILYLDTNMDAGHGGASGRFEALKELAKEFSFMLDLEKINK